MIKLLPLLEGGNAVDTNSAVPKEHLKSTVVNGLKMIGIRKYSMVGNVSKPILGDIDVAISKDDIGKLSGTKSVVRKEFYAAIEEYLKKKKVPYAIQSGFDQFNILVPLLDSKGKPVEAVDKDGKKLGKPGKIQLDVFVGNVKWMKDAMSGAPGSKYKSVYRNVLLATMFSKIIMKSKTPDVKRKFQFNFKNGVELVLFKDGAKGKKIKLNKRLITSDANDISRILFDDSVKWKDINDFEKVWKHFKSSKFKFPNLRNDITNEFKNTLERMKKPIPTEIK